MDKMYAELHKTVAKYRVHLREDMGTPKHILREACCPGERHEDMAVRKAHKSCQGFVRLFNATNRALERSGIVDARTKSVRCSSLRRRQTAGGRGAGARRRSRRRRRSYTTRDLPHYNTCGGRTQTNQFNVQAKVGVQKLTSRESCDRN